MINASSSFSANQVSLLSKENGRLSFERSFDLWKDFFNQGLRAGCRVEENLLLMAGEHMTEFRQFSVL